MGIKLQKFGKKYQFFLSEASNDEIVTISKELSDEMARQAQSLGRMGTIMIAVNTLALSVVIILVASGIGQSTKYDTYIDFARFAVIGILCIGLWMSTSAMKKSISVVSMSPVIWRNIRESVNDESAYEQIASINKLNRHLFVGRNDLGTSTTMLFIGMTVLAITYVLEIIVGMGYI